MTTWFEEAFIEKEKTVRMTLDCQGLIMVVSAEYIVIQQLVKFQAKRLMDSS
jgi:hypothetical protein